MATGAVAEDEQVWAAGEEEEAGGSGAGDLRARTRTAAHRTRRKEGIACALEGASEKPFAGNGCSLG